MPERLSVFLWLERRGTERVFLEIRIVGIVKRIVGEWKILGIERRKGFIVKELHQTLFVLYFSKNNFFPFIS